MDMGRLDRSFTEVVADIFRNVQDMLRSEIRLAQSQVRDDLARARPAAIFVVAAAGAAFLSAFFVLLAIAHALQLVMPEWAAALCVAAMLALGSAIALASGVKRFRALSSATGRHFKERVGWVKEPSR